MKYSTLPISIVTVICVIVMTGCATRSAEPPRETFTFDYTPSKEGSPGSADVTFAIIRTRLSTPVQQAVKQLPSQSITFWTGSRSWGYQQGVTQLSSQAPVPLFEDFANTITKDFMEVLGAHGFGARGPFKVYDEMIHPDKEGSDLTLTAEIEFILDDNGIKWNKIKNDKWDPGEPPDYFAPSGSIRTECHVSLVISESLTNERMWTKSIVIAPFTVSIPKTPKFGEILSSEILFAFLMKHINAFHSQVGLALVAQYDDIGNKIYGYLDPREMAIVKNQAMELRKRKVY